MLFRSERSFCVLPAYPYLNLWPEMIEALGGSTDKPVAARSAVDKVRMSLDGTDSKFQREALPLAAIYVLAERSTDPRAPFVEVLPPPTALMNLVANTYGNAILNSAMRAQEFRVLGQIAQSLPIRSLVPGNGTARLARLYDLVCDDRRRKPLIVNQI